ncbi:MAG: NDP-hexose 4-ketoreductase, partial [Actinomycetota bacterium]|nr:NDP-hexose 4-ketoreductase [Actinomycetota bacterium]
GEGSGIAARTLQSLGVSLDAVRELVVQGVPGGAEAGPGEMTPPLTPQATRLLGEASTAAAGALGHNYVGTEHLLLALCTQPNDSVAKILVDLGVSGGAARAKVLQLLTECSQGEATSESA